MKSADRYVTEETIERYRNMSTDRLLKYSDLCFDMVCGCCETDAVLWNMSHEMLYEAIRRITKE